MSDIDFYGAKPGDICNHGGDIRGVNSLNEARIIKNGVVVVTPAQAEFAKRYGWQLDGEWANDAALVQIRRE